MSKNKNDKSIADVIIEKYRDNATVYINRDFFKSKLEEDGRLEEHEISYIFGDSSYDAPTRERLYYAILYNISQDIIENVLGDLANRGEVQVPSDLKVDLKGTLLEQFCSDYHHLNMWSLPVIRALYSDGWSYSVMDNLLTRSVDSLIEMGDYEDAYAELKNVVIGHDGNIVTGTSKEKESEMPPTEELGRIVKVIPRHSTPYFEAHQITDNHGEMLHLSSMFSNLTWDVSNTRMTSGENHVVPGDYVVVAPFTGTLYLCSKEFYEQAFKPARESEDL